MLRLAGSVMVIAGCIGFAAGICRERNQRLRLLVQIRAVYETMKYYIAYQKATIPEALMHLSEKEQEPFGEAFEAVYRGIYEGSENLPAIWREQMERALSGTPLKEQEKKLLYDFPRCLGFMEESAQALALDGLIREAGLQIEQMEKQRQEKNRMIMSLGAAGGVLLSILLL